jgi:hypothetical protein
MVHYNFYTVDKMYAEFLGSAGYAQWRSNNTGRTISRTLYLYLMGRPFYVREAPDHEECVCFSGLAVRCGAVRFSGAV